MLHFRALTKAFGGRPIIAAAQGALGPGRYALQGPNGTGKSTLLALLAGALDPDAGTIRVDGVDLRDAPTQARQRLGYAPDESPVYPFITGADWLDFVAAARRCPAAPMAMIDELGLTPHLGTRFDAMSLGTQKKFLLCAAWIGDPPVLLLDEPSNGLDLASRDAVARRIAARPARSLTLFASHDSAFVAACGATVVSLDALTGRQVADAPRHADAAGLASTCG